jgi:hypothetical protein
MSANYTGGRKRGAIRYLIGAQSVMAGHCQCHDCQRDSGTGHASQLVFPGAAVKLEGWATHWDKTAASE